MVKNRVNGCHGNCAFFHSAIEFIFGNKKNLCISWVPINDLAPMKNCLEGCKVGQISSRALFIVSHFACRFCCDVAHIFSVMLFVRDTCVLK